MDGKSKTLSYEEINTIKNLSEFGVDLYNSNSLFSDDLNYGVLYNTDTITILDLNKRTILTKYYSDEDSTLMRVKLTNKNYLLIQSKFSSFQMIRVTKIGFLSDDFEVRIKDDIIDYIFTEQVIEGNTIEFLFLLTKQGDLITHNFTTDKKTSVNVITDSDISRQLFRMQNYFHFLSDKRVLLIFFSNGAFISYSLDVNPESFIDDPTDIRTYFDEVRSLKCLKSNNIEEIEQEIRSLVDDTTIKSIKEANFPIIYDDITLPVRNLSSPSNSMLGLNTKSANSMSATNAMNAMHIDNDKISEIGYFFMVNYEQKVNNQTSTCISFFQVMNNSCLTYVNRFIQKGSEFLDSYIFYSLKMHYYLLCLYNPEKNEINYYQANIINTFSNKSYQRDIIDNEVIKLNNDLSLNKEDKEVDDYKDQIFAKINSSKNIYNSKNYHIVGAQIKYNSNLYGKLMEQIDKEDYIINLNLRIFNFQGFNFYIIDTETGGSNFFNNKNGIEMHLDISSYLNKINSMDEMESRSYKQKTIMALKTSYSNESKIDEKSIEIDFFLINLMLNNEIFLIRNYLNLKRENNTYIVANDMIFKTGYEVFYEVFLSKTILKTLQKLKEIIGDQGKFKDNAEDMNNAKKIRLFNFFKDGKVLKNLETSLAIMRIVLSRIIHPYSTPYSAENELIREDSEAAQVKIMEIKKMITIVKIMRCYDKIFHLNRNSEANQLISDNLNKRRKTTEYKFKTFFDIIMQTNKENERNYPNLVQFLLSSVENSSVTNFQIFFYYHYYILDLYLISRIKKYKLDINKENENFDHCKNINKWELQRNDSFYEMNDLYNEYSKMIINIYAFDLNLETKAIVNENLILSIEDLNKFFDAVSNDDIINFINNNNNINSNIYINNKNISNINNISINSDNISNNNTNQSHLYSNIIKSLFFSKYQNEALILCRKLTTHAIFEFEDMKTLVNIMLETNLISEAYIYINSSCFTTFNIYEDKGDKNNINNSNINNNNMKLFQQLLITFFVFLIRTNKTNLLLSIPFNDVEASILEKFLILKGEYCEILLLYYIKQKRVKESKVLFDKIKNDIKSDNLRQSYMSLIDNLEFMFSGQDNDESMKKVLKSNVYSNLLLNETINAPVVKPKEKLSDKKGAFKAGINANFGSLNNSLNTSMNNSLNNSYLNDRDERVYLESRFKNEYDNNKSTDSVKGYLNSKVQTAKKIFGLSERKSGIKSDSNLLSSDLKKGDKSQKVSLIMNQPNFNVSSSLDEEKERSDEIGNVGNSNLQSLPTNKKSVFRSSVINFKY